MVEAWISYNSRACLLSVNFTNFKDGGTHEFGITSLLVNLSQVLPEWVPVVLSPTFVGFTATTGIYNEMHKILSWKFSTDSDDLPNPRRHGNLRVLVMWLGIFAGSLGGSLGIVWFLSRRKWVRNEEDDVIALDEIDRIDDDFRKRAGPLEFYHHELALATNDFDEKGKLGEGGLGDVYKGHLRKLNSDLAVKRVSRNSKQGIKEYASEVKIISQLRHRNLVQLIGWCHEKGQLLRACEFMPNGSLDLHLFKGVSFLSWEVRHRIAQDLASTFLYLHEFGNQRILHRGIKSSNMMLDTDFNAKLGDFGLAKFVNHDKGFKVVTLEIACGRRSIEQGSAEEYPVQLVEWVWDLYGLGMLFDAADPRLSKEFVREQMKCLMLVGL
ncbi:hypothetical protein EUGRSUZ_L02638 [Eucalyptus grandis]|uniref:Protein kinase domain-containing protein n=1 Tax=Eucalyptus grandis TaxID=71139 RepID=A0AAD9T9C5_EUCGR|nr:hypothetical protein EUGRSUZ_L02638 [Eucalyptus grandis]